MFGIEDIPKFILAFFILLPVISTIHELGHVFFAWLMGGRTIKITIGTGKPVFRRWILEVRQYYFWYGFCTFDNVKRQRRLASILIFSGGALFNLLAAIGIRLLVEGGILEESLFTYQFTYFSLYYIFFALMPIPYPDGTFSDGRIILDLIRGRQEIIEPHVFYVQQYGQDNLWQVLNEQDELIERFKDETAAITKANELAINNRPSKVISNKDGEMKEINNYPRLPL